MSGDNLRYIRNNAFLIIIFILALPVFVWLRWDPAPWFDAQLKSSGVSPYVHVGKVEKSGLGLRLSMVRIRVPGGPNISLNRVQLNPAWFRIIRGTSALYVQGTAGDATFALGVSMRDGAIWLRDIDIRAPAGMIRDYVPQAALLNLAGSILISGEMELRRSNGFPLAGTMTLQWERASSGLLGQDPLGNFQLHLASSEESAWQWQIKGGKILSIDGSGHFSTEAQNPSLWKVDGNIHAQSRGRIASLLSGMTGHDRGNLVLSGNLLQPRLKFLKPLIP